MFSSNQGAPNALLRPLRPCEWWDAKAKQSISFVVFSSGFSSGLAAIILLGQVDRTRMRTNLGILMLNVDIRYKI